jgi:hypothetical protein
VIALLRRALRRCRRRRAGRLPAAIARRERVTGQGNRIDVGLLRAFLKRALEDDAVVDPVNELLFEHVVAGRFHSSVVAENLPAYITEILGAATREDWQAVADELIAEAREVDGDM